MSEGSAGKARREAFARQVVQSISAPWISKANLTGGHCAGHVRENLWRFRGHAGEPPAGLDAKGQGQWLLSHGWQRIEGHKAQIGDICYWPKRGLHGHVAVRVPGNRYGENSVRHDPTGEGDGRGFVDMADMPVPTYAVRLPVD
jgi:hypothetical protein